MGVSKKVHEGDFSEGKKWVIAGITSMRAPLKCVSTRKMKEEGENLNSGNTTPTSKESRIPETLPAPPRKRRPAPTCHNLTSREFFTSPELDSLFEHFSKGK